MTIGNGRAEKTIGSKVKTVLKFKYFPAPFNLLYPTCTKEKKWKNIIKSIGCHLTGSKVSKKYLVKVSFPFMGWFSSFSHSLYRYHVNA